MSGISNTSGITQVNPTLGLPLSAYSSGSVYSLTDTAAALVFGTTSPTITLGAAGTYLITATALLIYNAVTFAAVRDILLKLRRTNNTAGDLANSSITLKTDILTLITGTAVTPTWQTVYTTATSGDVISIFGSVSVVPTAGSLDATSASLVAIRLV